MFRLAMLNSNSLETNHNHVVLPFRHDFPSCFGFCFISVFPHDIVVVHYALDECLLEVCTALVNDLRI